MRKLCKAISKHKLNLQKDSVMSPPTPKVCPFAPLPPPHSTGGGGGGNGSRIIRPPTSAPPTFLLILQNC